MAINRRPLLNQRRCYSRAAQNRQSDVDLLIDVSDDGTVTLKRWLVLALVALCLHTICPRVLSASLIEHVPGVKRVQPAML